MNEYRNANFQLPPSKFIASDGITYNGCLPPESELLAAGYYPCVPATKPEGDYRDSWGLVDGQWVQVWAAYDQRADRLAALSPHIPDILQLCGLLAGFGVSLPCERADAKAAIYSAVKSAPSKAADAILAVDILHRLDAAGVTDSDILLVATSQGAK